MSLLKLSSALRKRITVGVMVALIAASLGLYARLRYVNAKYVAAVTERIRLAAELDGAVAEGKRVRKIDAAVGQSVIDAGAVVTGKVAARVERRSEAGGDATVEVRGTPTRAELPLRPDTLHSGHLTLTDTHERFEASADYGLHAGTLRLDRVAWRIHQIFEIETIQFSQRVEGETLWQGYAVTLKEVSPKTGEEIEKWVVPFESINAEYVPTKRLRKWAMFTAAGFTYHQNGWDDGPDPGLYGEVGLRVKKWVGAVGLSDYSAYGRVGYYKEW